MSTSLSLPLLPLPPRVGVSLPVLPTPSSPPLPCLPLLSLPLTSPPLPSSRHLLRSWIAHRAIQVGGALFGVSARFVESVSQTAHNVSTTVADVATPIILAGGTVAAGGVTGARDRSQRRIG